MANEVLAGLDLRPGVKKWLGLKPVKGLGPAFPRLPGDGEDHQNTTGEVVRDHGSLGIENLERIVTARAVVTDGNGVRGRR